MAADVGINITKCGVCGSHRVQRYFALRNSPSLQNVLYDTADAARAARTLDAEFWSCEVCQFLFNPTYEEQEYSTTYNNDQSFSPAYRAHLSQVIEFLKPYLNPDHRIVEIGCGNGLMLSFLEQQGFARVEGYDPAHANGLPFVRREYWRASGQSCDALIFRHTVEGLVNFREVVGNSVEEVAEAGILYFELTNARHIVENGFTVTLYHECPQYFSESAIGVLLADLGFYIHELRHFSGGELLGVVAKRKRFRRPAAGANLRRLAEFTNVCIWGIAGRTIHFLTHNAVDTRMVRFGVDVDPRKQGSFIPSTGQEIVAPDAAVARRPDAVVVLNDRYVKEIAAMFPYSIAILTNRDFYDE